MERERPGQKAGVPRSSGPVRPAQSLPLPPPPFPMHGLYLQFSAFDCARLTQPGRCRHSSPSSAGRPRFFCSGNLGYRQSLAPTHTPTRPLHAVPMPGYRYAYGYSLAFLHPHPHTNVHALHPGTHSSCTRTAPASPPPSRMLHHHPSPCQTRSACDCACLLVH